VPIKASSILGFHSCAEQFWGWASYGFFSIAFLGIRFQENGPIR